jgi:peroxiredoxin Q/BCP
MRRAVFEVGTKMPKFKLHDQNGLLRSSDEFNGRKNLVIYFYPKDETPGCISEACGFRDRYEEFLEHNCEVIGISYDTAASHQKFAEHYQLPFVLLSDPQREVAGLFGVGKAWLGLVPGRSTFIINKSGVLVARFDHQLLAKKHVKEALNALNNIKNG